jgi:hypothetical protein
MKFKEQVKVNADIINAYLHRNKITAGEFSAKLMYTNSWWSARRSTKNFIVPKAAAMRMCDVFGFKWSELVGENPPQETKEQPKTAESDDLKTFMLILQNIDEKLTSIEEQLKGLEWLHK